MKNKTQPISLLMVVHNEEKIIDRSLKSMDGMFDDIVIVHDGPCEDKTLKIAKKYTKKVFEEIPLTQSPEFVKVKWLNKNQKEKIFKHDYIFLFDADETMTDSLRKEILGLDLLKYDSYSAKQQSLDQTYKEAKSVLRLFKKDSVRLFGFYHNAPIPLNPKRHMHLKNAFIHHKYIYKSKKNRNSNFSWARLEAKKLITKEYNFYNFSKFDKFKLEINNYLRQIIFFRFLFRIYLYIKYSIKYSPKMSLRRLETYDNLTKYLIEYKKELK